MPMADTIRILLVKRGNMSLAELARKLGTTPQNLSNKMQRDNFSEKELLQIAEVLNCKFEAHFIMNDTGESV